jgi:3-hydroxyacyl-CoA dehydrogenase
VAAQTGHHVTIVEINEEAIKKAKNGIESSLQRVAKKLYKVIILKVIFITTSCTS